MLKLILATAIIFGLVFAGSAGYYILASESAAEAPSALVPSGSNASAVSQAAAPAPTATPLPDREDCEAIRGDDYRSDVERDHYLAHCQPTPVPGPVIVKPNPPAIPGPEVAGERWILVDLARQTTTAMIGETPLYSALVTTGKDEWETPAGTFAIVRRVQNETMTSVSIGAEENYELKDVLYTQYFTTVGHALHLNYWRDDSYFGSVRSSHGCVGMRLADAEFFWNFARTGTRVTIQ